MAHLFNKNEFYDYRSRICTNIKKTLEAKVELLTDTLPLPVPLHDQEHPEEIFLDEANIHILHNNQPLLLPRKILQLKSLEDILNIDIILQELNQQQIDELLELVPEKSMKNLEYALTGQAIHQTHLQDFTRKLKTGFFTRSRQREEQLMAKLSAVRMRQIYQQLLRKITLQRTGQLRRDRFMFEQDNSSVSSLEEVEEIEEMSDNSQATETEEELDDFIDEEYVPRIFFRYDYGKIKSQEQLLALGEQKINKKDAMYKITLPARPKNSDWVDNYRRQEFQRYNNPTKPWVYNCEDNRKVTVAPVAKKLSVLSGKPRDHPLLKSERPACVTILTLVRDAAARLPNAVGTRADISELLKESQYVNQDLPEDKLSNIVSGALDRLHYMTDACVKYDSQKKLWIYLHGDRNYQHPGWGQEGQDYLQKFPSKKKARYLE